MSALPLEVSPQPQLSMFVPERLPQKAIEKLVTVPVSGVGQMILSLDPLKVRLPMPYPMKSRICFVPV